MASKLKEKTIDCIKLKETIYANMWKESKASNLDEYIEWLKNEHLKIYQERQSRAVHSNVKEYQSTT